MVKGWEFVGNFYYFFGEFFGFSCEVPIPRVPLKSKSAILIVIKSSK